MKKENISVLVATDDNGCKWLAPLLVSIKKTTKSKVDIYVLFNDLSKENMSKLTSVVSDTHLKIHFTKMTSDFSFYVPKQWPLPALFRLKADSALPHVNKIIYLDIDTLVYRDLKDLWETHLGNNYLAACYGLDKERKLGEIDPEQKVKCYFNSGVLLMNLKQMRQDKIGEKCLKMMRHFNHQLKAPDQDVLNVVCAGKIQPLSSSWNWYVSMARRKQRKLKNIFAEYFSPQPSIIHYYSQYKPNRFFIYMRHPVATYRIWNYQKFFWKCIKETPYQISREVKIYW